MRKRTLLAMLLAGVCSVGVAACGGDDDEGSDAAPAAESTDAAAPAAGDTAAGKEVFTTNCAGCHTLADAAASGAVGPNLDDLKPDAARVEAKVKAGGGGMPAFDGQLDATQIANVSAYVASVAGG